MNYKQILLGFLIPSAHLVCYSLLVCLFCFSLWDRLSLFFPREKETWWMICCKQLIVPDFLVYQVNPFLSSAWLPNSQGRDPDWAKLGQWCTQGWSISFFYMLCNVKFMKCSNLHGQRGKIYLIYGDCIYRCWFEVQSEEQVNLSIVSVNHSQIQAKGLLFESVSREQPGTACLGKA